MESATIMKILLNMLLLAFAVHADTSLRPSSSPSTDIYSPSPSPFTDDSPSPSADDSAPLLPVPAVSPPSPTTVLPPPSPPLLPQPPPLPQFPPPEDDPQTPPLPQFPPPEVDPVEPPPMSCKDLCKLKCSEKHGLRRIFCEGKCLAICKIFPPSDHAGYQCTRDCVINNLHHQPGKNMKT